MILLQSYLDVEQRQCSLEKDMKTFEKETALSCSSAEELEKEELEKNWRSLNFAKGGAFQRNSPGCKRAKVWRGLSPRIEDGVLRVGGWLSKSCMPAEAKHLIILISVFLLRHIHQKVGHGGQNYLLSRLRELYWITGANTAIKQVISSCVICQRLNTRIVRISADGRFAFWKNCSRWTSFYACWSRVLWTFWGKEQEEFVKSVGLSISPAFS